MSVDRKEWATPAACAAGVAVAGYTSWGLLRRFFEGRCRARDEPPIVWAWRYARGALKEHPGEFLLWAQKKYGDTFTVRLDRRVYQTYVLDPTCFDPALNAKGLNFADASRNSKRRFGLTVLLEKDEGVHNFSVAMRNAFGKQHLEEVTVTLQLRMREQIKKHLPKSGASINLLSSASKIVMVATAGAIFGKEGWDGDRLPNEFDGFNENLGFRLAGEVPGDIQENEHATFLKSIASPEAARARTDVSPMFKSLDDFVTQRGSSVKERDGAALMLLWGALVNTTSTAFWLLHDIFASGAAPELLKELETISPKGPDRTFTLEQLDGDDCSCLWAAVQETLRLRSKPNNYRKVGQDTVLETDRPYRLRQDDWLALFPRVWHYNSDAFDEPEQWQWSRFLEDEGTRIGRRDTMGVDTIGRSKLTNMKMSYKGKKVKKPVYGFGGGQGLCPGEKFAFLVLTSLASEVLRSRSLIIAGEEPLQQDQGLSSVPWPQEDVTCRSSADLTSTAALGWRPASPSRISRQMSRKSLSFGPSGEFHAMETCDAVADAVDDDRTHSGIQECSVAASQGRRRVAIAGASTAGLVMARELLATGGFDVQLFESKGDVGGVYSSKAAYEGSYLTASCSLMAYGCYPSGQERFPTYWEIPKFVKYLDKFAEHYQLKDKIRFNTAVADVSILSAVDIGGNSMVAVSSKSASSTDDATHVDVFHHFIVCTGITGGGYHATEIPRWPGSTQTFQGQILHSNEFKSASQFACKRVLVVGMGESGSDIALLLCKGGAAKVCVQSRAGPGYVVPRMVLGRAADLDTNRIYHAIPWWLWTRFGWRSLKLRMEDWYLTAEDDRDVLKLMSSINKSSGESPKRRFGTKNESFVTAVVRHGAIYKQSEIVAFEEESVVFADGTTFACDTVIYCGGYAIRHDFFDSASVFNSNVRPRELYKRIVHPSFGLSICFIGMLRPGFGAIPPVCEMQSRLLTQWLSGEKALPSAAEMEVAVETDRAIDVEQFQRDGKRIGALGDFAKWMNDYADRIGCQPCLTRLLFTDPRLWWHVVAGQLNGMQFRLQGPGAMPEVRSNIVEMPLMPAPVLLVEFGICCVCKVLSALGLKAFALTGL